MSSNPSWLPALLAAGEALPPALRATILASPADAIPALIAMLTEPALMLDDAPGGGFAPIHATRLLLALDATDAIEPLLRVLAGLSWEDILYNEIVVGLPRFGPRGFGPTMAAFERATEQTYRDALLDILASLGVRDERVYAAALAALAANTERGAMLLADYGDPRALPVLLRVFDAHELSSPDELLHGQALIELEGAITQLGGTLTPAMQQRLDDVRAARQALFRGFDDPEPTTTVRRDGPKVGRNDPCPCGSGQKYKKCHGA